VLDYAEDQARRRKQVFLKDWEEKLNEFLRFNERSVLDDKGILSKSTAHVHAETEYEEFAARRRAVIEAESERDQQKVLENIVKNLPEQPKEKRRKPQSEVNSNQVIIIN